MSTQRFELIPFRNGILGKIMIIQSWSQLISSLIYCTAGFAIFFFIYHLLVGSITRQTSIFAVIFGLIGASRPLINCIPAILRISINPQGQQYWMSRVDEQLGRYGYREAKKTQSEGALKRYVSTVPNIFLPQRERGSVQLRPFVPRWARWKENEFRVYLSSDRDFINVIGPRRMLDRLRGDV